MLNAKKWSCLLLLQLILKTTNGQDLYYKSISLDKNPKVTSADKLDQSEGEIILKDSTTIEYTYEKSGDLVAYFTRYKKIKVFSDKGIEDNNKVYIPSGGVIEFMDIKARTISSANKVTSIESSAIKDVDDVENKGSYKMFAMEGIEKNSEIEYLYTYKRAANYFGTEYPQSKIPRLSYGFKIISPSNLTYEAKLYNTGLTTVKTDTLSNGKNIVSVSLTNIPGLKDELYSFYKSNLIRVEYKLAYNSVRGKARLFSWDNAADRYYHAMCIFDKKEISATNSLLKKIKISGSDEVAKARSLENYLKLKFEIKTDASDEYENIEKMVASKFTNSTGITRLYLSCLQQMNIKPEIVITCDKTTAKFDPDFDTWSYLDEFLIYLPTSNTYLAPNDILSRVGFVTPNYTGQKGLFIKEVDLGGETKAGIGKVKTIGYADYTASLSTIDADVTFPSNFSETNIKLKQTYTGYAAYYSQPLIGFLNDVQKKEYEEKTLKITGEDATMSNVSMSGIAENDILSKPFVMECVLKSPSLLETAGNKYLLKIGLLIGPQAEMYQDGKRTLQPQIVHTHMYNRKITVTIPDGYKLSNVEALNMQQKFMQDDKVLGEFISTYTLSANKLEVTVVEDYRVLDFPLDKFEDYRKVINAAADFNKIQIILEKK